MSSQPTSRRPRTAQIVTGAIVLLLLVALLATVFLSRGTTDDAESTAETRAVDWASTVLFDAVTPEEVAVPVLGPDYRELLIIVQAGILSDDRAVRVRLWNADGTLVFSTDQRDKIDEFIAADDPEIETALDGTTVSLPTEANVAPRSGLAGSDEKLFQTFVPLRLEGSVGVSGVAQIDQAYDAIEAEASDTWQTVRLVLVLALTVAVGAFLFTLRRRPAEEEAGVVAEVAVAPTRADRRALERASKADEELRVALERAERAEAALAETDATMSEAVVRLRELEERVTRSEERATNAEAALREAALAVTGGEQPRRGVPGVGAVAVGAASAELASKLEAAEAEREQLTGEVGRLRAALTEREAELALAREGASPDEEVEGLRSLATQHEERAADLDRRLVDAMRDLGEKDARIAEIESRLQEAELAVAAATAASAATLASSEEGSAAQEELRAARVQLTELQTKLTETESGLADATAKLAAREAGTSDLEIAHARTAKELEAARAELAKADAELATARETLASREEESSAARAAEAGVAALGAQLAEMETRLEQGEARATQAETRATELETRATDAEARATELETRATDAEARVAETEAAHAAAAAELERIRAAAKEVATGQEDVEALRARIEELEEARRSDVIDLQRAQETLANTQFEAQQARRRVKELEERLEEVEAAPLAPVPEYVPEPALAETSFSARLASLVREHEAPSAPTPPPAAEPEAPAPDEGLSLRERLARAAAARHRMSGTPGSDG